MPLYTRSGAIKPGRRGVWHSMASGFFQSRVVTLDPLDFHSSVRSEMNDPEAEVSIEAFLLCHRGSMVQFLEHYIPRSGHWEAGVHWSSQARYSVAKFWGILV